MRGEIHGLSSSDGAIRVMTAGQSYTGVKAKLALPGDVNVGTDDWSYLTFYLGLNGARGRIVEAGVSYADSAGGGVTKRGWRAFINTSHSGTSPPQSLGTLTTYIGQITMALTVEPPGRCTLQVTGGTLSRNIGFAQGAAKLVMAVHDPNDQVFFSNATFTPGSIQVRTGDGRSARWSAWPASGHSFREHVAKALHVVTRFPPTSRRLP